MALSSNGSDSAPVDHPAAESDEEVDARGERLRSVMRRVASPVTVVTAAAGGVLRGATIGSFTSVSLDPPLVSFNVQHGSNLHAVLRAADAFAVHLLGEEQADLATHFALPDLTSAEQFASVAHGATGLDRPPVIEGAFGVLHCRFWAAHDAGDHDLVLGEVERVTEGESAGPLLYYDRAYRAVGDEV